MRREGGDSSGLALVCFCFFVFFVFLQALVWVSVGLKRTHWKAKWISSGRLANGRGCTIACTSRIWVSSCSVVNNNISKNDMAVLLFLHPSIPWTSTGQWFLSTQVKTQLSHRVGTNILRGHRDVILKWLSAIFSPKNCAVAQQRLRNAALVCLLWCKQRYEEARAGCGGGSPETVSRHSQSSSPVSSRCPSTASACRTHEGWFPTQINTVASGCSADPGSKVGGGGREKKNRRQRRKKMAHASTFICSMRFIYFFFFSTPFTQPLLSKETVARCSLHLNPDAPGTGRYERIGTRPICLTADPSLSRRKMTDKGTQTMDDASRLSQGRNPLRTAAGWCKPGEDGAKGRGARGSRGKKLRAGKRVRERRRECACVEGSGMESGKSPNTFPLWRLHSRKLDIKTQIAFRQVVPRREILDRLAVREQQSPSACEKIIFSFSDTLLNGNFGEYVFTPCERVDFIIWFFLYFSPTQKEPKVVILALYCLCVSCCFHFLQLEKKGSQVPALRVALH